LLGPRNRMWFHFMSYKFGRLILPWIFIVLFISSCFLSSSLRMVAVGGQVLFYLLALVDPWITDTFALKRLTAMARTVVAMLVATLWGLTVLFVPPQNLWKETKIESSHL
jgi:hypothetical protein